MANNIGWGDGSNNISWGQITKGLTDEQKDVLKHLFFNEEQNRIEANKAIETTLNSLYLGDQHKMSSGAENIFFTNIGSDINFFPMWGGLKDQSIEENQGASGFIPPSGRVYTDLQIAVPNGESVDGTSIAYTGSTLYNDSIAGLGVKIVLAEAINHEETFLRYKLSVNGRQVYLQDLELDSSKSSGDTIEWFFDHPVEIHAGTNIFAEVRKTKLENDEDEGVLMVTRGNASGNPRHIEVYSRLFEDKDLELISPYLKYSSIDFGLDSTGSSIFVRDLSLPTDEELLVSHDINSLEAVANGSNIRIKLKGGKKVIIESLPVSGVSINGSLVNSVLNQAITQLNNLFSNTSGFSSGGNPVTNFDLSDNNLTLTLQDGTSYTVDVTTLGVDENKFVNSGALNGSNLELTMNDSSIITIDASNMINGSSLPAIDSNWYISYGNSSGDEITSPTIVNTYENKQPFYYGSFLEKGQEYTWTHDNNGTYIIGVYSGSESTKDETEITSNTNWSTNFKFSASNNTVRETSVGVDVASRFATGYNITNNTVLALRYGTDNYLSLYDISGSDEILIGRSNTALVGDSQTISFGGQNQPNAKFPVIIKREAQWSIVHDFDGTEGSLSDGLNQDSVIKSNISISQGEKFMVNINFAGRGSRFGIGYGDASSGVTNAHYNIDFNIIYSTAEQFTANDPNNEWTFNPNNTYYRSTLSGWWWRGGGNAGMISLRYNSDNSLELWSEDDSELIATKNVDLDGSPIYFYFGVNEATTASFIPSISKQTIGQGSQPITSFAPDISDQVIEITEGTSFSSNITLDSGSDIVNIYGEENAPSWAILNQLTGQFTGTAPAYTGSSDDYVVNCKGANALGGITSFTVTLRVLELTYTNTKSLFFEDGVSSYLGGNASLVTSLERASNGSGSSDAWSIGFWFKGSTENAGQTLFYFGNNDLVNGGHIEIRQTNHNGAKRLRLRYGSNANHIQITTPSGSITPASWQHVLVTYDGGTTGSSSSDMSDYYSRFKFYIDGVLMSTSNTHSNHGYTGSIVGQNFRFGRLVSGNYPKDLKLNQLAVWGSNESANISDIYNSGTTQDLSLLTSTPEHYYEIESSVTTIQDLIGNAHLVGYNFTSSDLINETP